MWPTCRTRRKQPSSSKRQPPPRPSISSHPLADKMISADPVRVGGDSGWIWPSPERQMKDQITINGHDGAFRAYIARPEALPAPAVVVLQELFGVNGDIREKCDELAEQGFLAVAPDLFWREEPGVDLSVRSEPDWQHGLTG